MHMTNIVIQKTANSYLQLSYTRQIGYNFN